MKKNQFELKADGSVERVGPFGSYGPTVDASTKAEATTKLLAFAYRALENTPSVKVREGAWQLAYESLHGVTVEAGVTGRESSALCISSVSDRKQLNDTHASFDYYASEAYRNA